MLIILKVHDNGDDMTQQIVKYMEMAYKIKQTRMVCNNTARERERCVCLYVQRTYVPYVPVYSCTSAGTHGGGKWHGDDMAPYLYSYRREEQQRKCIRTRTRTRCDATEKSF